MNIPRMLQRNRASLVLSIAALAVVSLLWQLFGLISILSYSPLNLPSSGKSRYLGDRPTSKIPMTPSQDARSSDRKVAVSRGGEDSFDPKTLPQGILDYIEWHKSELQHPTKKTRYIMYLCTQNTACGGFADRMRGIISLFYFAILTRTVLAIQWDRPVPLQETFSPYLVDWLTPTAKCQSTRTDQVYLVDRDFDVFRTKLGLDDSNQFGPRKNHSSKRLSPEIQERYGIICIKTNTNAYFHYMEMWDLGLDRALGLPVGSHHHDYPLAFWALRTMFKPTAKLEDRYLDMLASLKLSGSHPLVVAHLRMGLLDGGLVDPVRHQLTDVKKFAQCAQTMREQLSLGSNQKPNVIPVFVAADSQEAKFAMSQELANIKFLSDKSVHLDLSHFGLDKRQIWASNMKSFADFLMLARSTCLVASRSGFSYMAILWSSPPESQRRCWSFVDDCGNGSEFVSRKLVILPENRFSSN